GAGALMWPAGGQWAGFRRVVAAPNQHACTGTRLAIMPLGDSITYGTSSTTGDGYRAPLATLLNQTSPMGAGWLYEGSQESGSLFWSHEGHGGWTIDDLTNNITGWLAHPANTGEPIDLVLLDAGTNDDGLGHTSQQMLASMPRLLDKPPATTPTIKVVVP